MPFLRSLAAILALLAAPGASMAAVPAPPSDNPLLAPWTGPCGGVPPFDRVRPEHFEPAFAASMAEQVRAIEALVADPAAPSFANTLAALERSGRTLDRVAAVYGVFTSTRSDDDMQAVERRLEPRLAAHRDRIVTDGRLFARVRAVHENRAGEPLDAEQRRLAWLHHTTMARHGAALDDAAKRELSTINQELAELFTSFTQRVLTDEESQAVFLEVEADLAGLPAGLRDAAREAAAARGRPGAWAIPNTRSSVEPFLVHSERRDLRERVWRMFVSRGDGGGANDTNAVATRILALRARRAALLGFPTHAHWRLEDSMAKTPDRALELMEAVWKPAVARVRDEVAAMQAVADAEGAGIRIEPWDYRHYAEKVRRARYDLDDAEITPYLELEKLREGMFFVAERLFGLRLRAVASGTVPTHHDDVRVWEVVALDGRPVGLWYFDPFARAGKRSGAWMSDYRGQERLDGAVLPIVSNNCNFTRPAPGKPVLVSWDDATTLFHEFGHALHGLCSSVTYPSLAGTNVARDYVEFPSQLLEHWLSTPEVLEGFALHHRTGEPIPADLAAKIARAKRFNEGFRTVEFLASALVDMRLHLAGATPIDTRAFERDTLAALGMPREIVMRHRIPHFAHVFGDDGYAAGYYSYLWADVITADAWEAFADGGGPWDEALAARLRERVFSAGNTVDPAEGYRSFRGRDPRVDALMRKRGFSPPQ